MKYNELTVLDEVKDKGRWKFKVQCDCGRIDLKRKDWVISGRSKSCKSCASKRTALNYPPPVRRTGAGNLSGTHFLSIKHGAIRRNIPFDLTPEYLWDLFQEQKGRCALTDLPLELSVSLKNQNVNWDVITASVDRVDSNIGYIKGNVWWVHKRLNRFKNNYSLDELKYFSKLILDKHGNPDPSIVKDIEVAMKEQRLGGEESNQ